MSFITEFTVVMKLDGGYFTVLRSNGFKTSSVISFTISVKNHTNNMQVHNYVDNLELYIYIYIAVLHNVASYIAVAVTY